MLVDRRRLVPGDLRHVVLDAGARDFNVFDSLAALFGRQPRSKRINCTPVTIEIWGVAADGLAIPWAQVTHIVHRKVDRGSDNNRVFYSQLDFELDDQILRAEAEYAVMLDVLADLHPKLSHESTRPVALTLDRARSAEGAESFERLLSAARTWLASDEGRTATICVEGDYRKAKRVLQPELLQELKIALVEAPTAGDRGPFAAIVAAELGVVSLEDELAALTSSALPLAAAVSIGAALRLGVSPIRVGKPEHVEPYIDATTAREISAWASGG